jgi:two-component system, OmpR family, sensor histidine kinase TctE
VTGVVTSLQARAARSVFRQILEWMLAPLVIVWPISLAVTYLTANSLPNAPYDRELHDTVVALAQQVKVTEGQAQVDLPPVLNEFLRSDGVDDVYFQIRAPDGRILAGDVDFPALPAGIDRAPGVTYYLDSKIRGQEIRVAYRLLIVGRGFLTIQVAETRRKREHMAHAFIRGVILPQVVLVPLSLLLVWLGLHYAMAPLKRLQKKIQARSPNDLSPIAEGEIPIEVRPLIHAFNALLGKLQQNLEAQNRFIADAAHQMRTPIAGLKTQTQLALRETDPQQVHHTLRQIQLSVERTAHLINQLLSMARADASQRSNQPLLTLDLCALCRKVLSEWFSRSREMQIELGFEPAALSVFISGDALHLAEMLNNLIDNALRYTPRGGSVTVRVRELPQVTLEIEDTGIGVMEGERELVFEPFYRVLGTGAEGTGLGLAIVRGIARSHRAEVSLQPRIPPPGTLVRIVFADSNWKG